ncbi:MAG: hypothetical protein M3Y08_00645 [Fibrobacterota bacterium]|nr:hypothetical protein [Fibrobacterota bacterium]
MIVNVVRVHVKPEPIPEFLAATRCNHKGSRVGRSQHVIAQTDPAAW